MTVVWAAEQGNRKPSNASLLVNQLSTKGITVQYFSQQILLSKLKVYSEQIEGTDDDVCLLIDVWDKAFVDSIVRIMLVPNLFRRPKLVLLSSLLTWAGKRYSTPIEDSNNAFLTRRPAAAAQNAWISENNFWNMASRVKADAYIVGLGLLYGQTGYDFKDIFKSLWLKTASADAAPTLVPSRFEGRNVIPAIHIDDAVELLYNIVASRGAAAGEPSLGSTNATTIPGGLSPAARAMAPPSLSPDGAPVVEQAVTRPLFLHATDNSAIPLAELFPQAGYLTQDQIMEAVCDSDSVDIHLWSSDISFSQPLFFGLTATVELTGAYRNGLSAAFQTIWNQYVQLNNFGPVKVIIVGGPKVGKTTLAENLAERLNLQYVGLVPVIKFVLDNEDDLSEEGSSAISALRSEMVAAMEAAVDKKASKKKDKGAPEGARINSSNTDLSDAICYQLPGRMIRRAVNLFIEATSKCQLSGYVVDVFSPAIQTFEDFQDTLLPPAPVSAPVPDAEASETSENVIETLDLKTALEVLIELHCPDAIIMKKYADSLGVDEKGKVSKESLALQKALEASQQTYNEKMKLLLGAAESDATQVVEGDDSGAVTVSHEAVQAVSTRSSTSVVRVARSADEALSTAEAILSRSISLITNVHGPIGWFQQEPEQAQAPAATGQLDLASTEAASDERVEGDVAAEGTASSSSAAFELQAPSLQSTIASFGPNEVAMLEEKCNVLQTYLLDNVLPHLVNGMVKISREQPDDPIAFLEAFIREVGRNIENSEVEKVRERFYRTIKDVETK